MRFSHTLHGEAVAERIEAVTAANLIWYVTPLLLLAACFGLYLATKGDTHHAGPAE